MAALPLVTASLAGAARASAGEIRAYTKAVLDALAETLTTFN